MDYQELYELADAEVRLGIYDRTLMGEAVNETNGNRNLAGDVYCRLRAKQVLEEIAGSTEMQKELYLKEIEERVRRQDRGVSFRSSLLAWISTIACVVGLVGSSICFYFAATRLFRDDESFFRFGFGGLFCLIIAVVGFIFSKRSEGSDPFSMRNRWGL